jgi:hypothetical protein
VADDVLGASETRRMVDEDPADENPVQRAGIYSAPVFVAANISKGQTCQLLLSRRSSLSPITASQIAACRSVGVLEYPPGENQQFKKQNCIEFHENKNSLRPF